MVVYEGPSVYNGDPIVGIITGITAPSTNVKTGPMAQLWILDANTEPHVAVKSGADESVCGSCPARGKWCYVTTFQGPLSIYRTWKRGGYSPFESSRLHGMSLRLGAYGDPAALPLSVIEEITSNVKSYTGYTHAWRDCDEGFRRFCMASVDSVEESLVAQREGWRTFRVTAPNESKRKGESVCPASAESGRKITCFDCGACDGRRRPTVKSNIVIEAHGSKTKRFIEEFA
jgi:hypothetical protein